MKRALAFVVVGLLILLSAAQIFGDIARPKTSPAPEKEGRIVFHTGLTIVPDAKATEARLQIGQDGLQSLREALASVEGGSSNISLGQRIAHSSTRTIMAGLFLCLSLSFAGVWLARSNHRRSQKAIVAAVLGIALIGAATIITRANAGPPGYYRWRTLPENLTKGEATSGGLDIEIVPGDSYLKLIVPIRKQKQPGEE